MFDLVPSYTVLYKKEESKFKGGTRIALVNMRRCADVD